MKKKIKKVILIWVILFLLCVVIPYYVGIGVYYKTKDEKILKVIQSYFNVIETILEKYF